jgi:hypothetical protein
MKKLIDIINTKNEPNILQSIQWGSKRPNLRVKKKSNKMQPEVIKDIESSELVSTYYHVPIFEMHDGTFTCDIWSEAVQENIEIYDISIENIEERLRVILVENYYKSLAAISNHYNQNPDFNNPESNLENLRDAIEVKVKNFLKDL